MRSLFHSSSSFFQTPFLSLASFLSKVGNKMDFVNFRKESISKLVRKSAMCTYTTLKLAKFVCLCRRMERGNAIDEGNSAMQSHHYSTKDDWCDTAFLPTPWLLIAVVFHRSPFLERVECIDTFCTEFKSPCLVAFCLFSILLISFSFPFSWLQKCVAYLSSYIHSHLFIMAL